MKVSWNRDEGKSEELKTLKINTFFLIPILLLIKSVRVRTYRQCDEDEYRNAVNNFVTWCEQNQTKELVVDLRKTKTPMTPVSIQRGQCGYCDGL